MLFHGNMALINSTWFNEAVSVCYILYQSPCVCVCVRGGILNENLNSIQTSVHHISPAHSGLSMKNVSNAEVLDMRLQNLHVSG